MTDPSASRKPRPGLGRGLSALMGDIAREEPVAEGAPVSTGVRTLPVGSLKPHPGQGIPVARKIGHSQAGRLSETSAI